MQPVPTCPSCGAEISGAVAECPHCLVPVRHDENTAALSYSAETRLASSSGGGHSPAAGARPASGSGWLSSSDAIDHGRFPPGTILGSRYRIIGRLGRGGMGEVYRADDLKLGQAVALKFLPPDVDRDPARLTQLHTEVRMARQVSHPNVCRVYDIDEVDGHTFLSMEYVDGEDLASLLRRIGRFSVDRALEVARQVCAGLAAAHERGIVHRDFKPANVMVDGAGHVRITDFGLAGTTGEAIRAGTPAYMAPEQLTGAEVTPRSDLYALGLVLYEVFTGRRALEAKSLGELVRKREEGGLTLPSEIVRELDPAVDRAILRCLERDPANRPPSALAVSAALPGGDPLAAALAAGETPSPEMVAAAGEAEALGAVPAFAAFATVLLCLVLLAGLSDRVSITGVVPIPKPPEVLADRAETIARQLGYAAAPADTAHGFEASGEFLDYANEHPATVTRARLASGRPAALIYWYRASPGPLVPGGDNREVTLNDPALTVAGMTSMILDPEGRLRSFTAVPPQFEAADATPPATPDWDALFAAADLRRGEFTSVPPAWTPPVHADARAAWEGPLPGWPEMRLHLEAASYKGRPVYFDTIEPWKHPAGTAAGPSSVTARLWQAAAVATMVLILGSATLVARHNLRIGRGDRRSALRVSGAILATSIAAWLLTSAHFSDPGTEVNRTFGGIAHALWSAGVVWVLYIALEPYVRRFWPWTLTSWSRLLAGNWRDPIVGRDVLIGNLFGAAVAVLLPAYALLTARMGHNVLAPDVPRLGDLNGLRYVAAAVGDVWFNIMFNSMWVVFGLVMLRLILKRPWAAAVAAVLFFSLSADIVQSGPTWLRTIVSGGVLAALVYLGMRFGLLATVAFFFFNNLVASAVLTADPSKWFFATSAWMLGLGAAVVAYGFYISRGGEPLLGRRILD